jgi:hypothetical protein
MDKRRIKEIRLHAKKYRGFKERAIEALGSDRST